MANKDESNENQKTRASILEAIKANLTAVHDAIELMPSRDLYSKNTTGDMYSKNTAME